ncbi:hypothetical protein HMPREF0577_0185 [Mobiluncus mulieris ATCC 35243]|nr:hypothetical protein HMPREF0577_0185 [Mobiluncus mulieris ATCC 35243]
MRWGADSSSTSLSASGSWQNREILGVCEGVCGKFRRIRGGVADLVHGGAGFS